MIAIDVILALEELASPLHAYRPQAKPGCDQAAFHADLRTVRFVKGGNRSGKTTLPAMEGAALATGMRPWWFAWPEVPVGKLQIWIVVPQFPASPLAMPAIVRKLFTGEAGTDEAGKPTWREPLIPRHRIAYEDVRNHVWQLDTGHVILLKATTQSVASMAGEAVALVIVDEPTTDRHYEELRARIVSVAGGRMIVGATQTDDAAIEANYPMLLEADEAVGKHELSTKANAFIDQARVEEFAAGLGMDGAAIRVGGTSAGGLRVVYPTANRHPTLDPPHWDDDCGTRCDEFPDGLTRRLRGNFVKPFDIPATWSRFAFCDPQIANTACMLWIAVDRPGNLYCYRLRYLKRPGSNLEHTLRRLLAGVPPDEPISDWFIDPFSSNPRQFGRSLSVKAKPVIDLYREVWALFRQDGTLSPKGADWRRGVTSSEKRQRVVRSQCLSAYLAFPANAKPGDKPQWSRKPCRSAWILDLPEMQPLRQEFDQYKRARRTAVGLAPEWAHRGADHAISCLEGAASMPLAWRSPPDPGLPVSRGLPTCEDVAARNVADFWASKVGG